MGFKYRKSIKIAAGVRVNLGKKSASVSIGGKGFRKTYSTSGRKTTTVGIPGSGLSYSTSTSTLKKPNANSTSEIQSHSSKTVSETYKTCSIVCFVLSISLMIPSLFVAFVKPIGFLWIAIGLFLFAMGFVYKKLADTAYQKEEAERLVRNAELEAKRLARNAELLEWQNAVCEDNSEKLFMSAKQLEAATAQAVSDDMRIFDDCSNLLNKTANPSVFFHRLALAEEKLLHLCSLERYMEKMSSITMNQKPSELYNLFIECKERYICDFIYKYYHTVKDKAETLKTERGKQNQYQKFYDSLQPYFNQISEKNMGYIEAMYQRKI